MCLQFVTFDSVCWEAIVTSSDRAKSVHNRCVIEVLVVFVLSRCVLGFSVGVGAFVIGPSQICSFLSYIIRPQCFTIKMLTK